MFLYLRSGRFPGDCNAFHFIQEAGLCSLGLVSALEEPGPEASSVILLVEEAALSSLPRVCIIIIIIAISVIIIMIIIRCAGAARAAAAPNSIGTGIF